MFNVITFKKPIRVIKRDRFTRPKAKSIGTTGPNSIIVDDIRESVMHTSRETSKSAHQS